MLRTGFEPWTICMPESRLIHCTASVVVKESIVTVYAHCLTWRLVTYVRSRTSSAPHSRHDVASQSITMDLCEAEVCCEASLGSADVAAHSSSIEKQSAA